VNGMPSASHSWQGGIKEARGDWNGLSHSWQGLRRTGEGCMAHSCAGCAELRTPSGCTAITRLPLPWVL